VNEKHLADVDLNKKLGQEKIFITLPATGAFDGKTPF